MLNAGLLPAVLAPTEPMTVDNEWSQGFEALALPPMDPVQTALAELAHTIASAAQPGGQHHNTGYDFNDAAIPTGVAWWCAVVEAELG